MHQGPPRRSLQLKTVVEIRREAIQEWKFVHFLAAATAIEIVLLICIQILRAFLGPVIHAPAVVIWVVAVGAFLLMWFWIRMIVDFVRERPERHTAAWGWALFLGAYFGALAYFVAVWRPRHQVGAK